MPLHRPYIRSSVRAEVEKRAQKNEKGQFLDANTGQAIEGQYDLGHKPGHEHWREAEKAEKEGLTQEQFNERMNNPDFYQIEDPHENRSHVHEQPKDNSCERGQESPQDKSSKDNVKGNTDNPPTEKNSSPERGQKPPQDAGNPPPQEATPRGHLPEDTNKVDPTNSPSSEATKAADEASKNAAGQQANAVSSSAGMSV